MRRAFLLSFLLQATFGCGCSDAVNPPGDGGVFDDGEDRITYVCDTRCLENGWCYECVPAGFLEVMVDLWGPSPYDIYMVAFFPGVFHWDGMRWERIHVLDGDFPFSIHGSGPNNVFVVGWRDWNMNTPPEEIDGAIHHYDGENWTVETLEDDLVSDIWCLGPTNCYLIGAASGSVYHHDGTTLSKVSSFFGQGLSCIWGDPSGELFIGGADGLLMRYDGDGWITMESPTLENVNGIFGCSTSDVYAVTGRSEVDAHGDIKNYSEVVHYDGTRWDLVYSTDKIFLKSIYCAKPDDVYAVGWLEMGPGLGTRGVLFHFDGDSWYEVIVGLTGMLAGVWGTGAGNVYAVGAGPTVLHYAP